MSTRSIIADATSGKAIYCHSDGYVEGVGKTLYRHYNTPQKVKALIKLGAISALEERVAPARGVPHGFDFKDRAPGVTVAFHRERGDKLFHMAATDNPPVSDTEYKYIWTGSRWLLWKGEGVAAVPLNPSMWGEGSPLEERDRLRAEGERASSALAELEALTGTTQIV